MFKKRINKKAVLLKIIFGAMGGGITCLYIEKMDFNGNPFLLIFGSTLGLFAGLASIPFRTIKVIHGLIGGFLAGSLLILLNIVPDKAIKDVVFYLMLPMCGFFIATIIGSVDKFSKSMINIIGSIIAGFISFGIFVIGAIYTLGLSWKYPCTRWPMYSALVIIGMVMLFGIGIKECFEDAAKI